MATKKAVKSTKQTEPSFEEKRFASILDQIAGDIDRNIVTQNLGHPVVVPTILNNIKMTREAVLKGEYKRPASDMKRYERSIHVEDHKRRIAKMKNQPFKTAPSQTKQS